MTRNELDYGELFDQDSQSPEFKLELLSLRLSHLIEQAMHARGMSRSDLARELDVSSPMVTKILSGRSNFTLKTLVLVADALGYEYDPVFRPKDYSFSMEFTFSQEFASSPTVESKPAVTGSFTTLPRASRSIYGETSWNFAVQNAMDKDAVCGLQAA